MVGGGIAAMALALDLAQRGQAVVLAEQRVAGDTWPGYFVLARQSLEYFRAMGIDREILAAALPPHLPYVHRLCVGNLAGEEIARFEGPSVDDCSGRDPQAAARYPSLHWSPTTRTPIDKRALEEVLRRRVRSLPNLEARFGWRLEGLQNLATHVEAELVELASGRRESVVADYLVACDGAEGWTRRALGIPAAVSGPPLQYIEGVFRSRTLRELMAERRANLLVVLDSEYPGFIHEVDGADLWQYSALRRSGELIDRTQLSHWLLRTIGRPCDIEWLYGAEKPIKQHVASRYREGRVLLAGDAAHPLISFWALSEATALGDARNLAWKLDAVLRGWAHEVVLDSYERERHPVAAERSLKQQSIFGSYIAVLQDIAAAGSRDPSRVEPLPPRVRDSAIALWSRFFGAESASLLNCYRYSPCIAHDSAADAPPDPGQSRGACRPGRRAPHMWMRDGRSTLDLFGRDFVLLRVVHDGDAPSDVDAHRWREAAGAVGMPLTIEVVADAAVAALYSPRWLLIRPDGIIAWQGDALPQDPVGVLDRVRGFFTPPPPYKPAFDLAAVPFGRGNETRMKHRPEPLDAR